MKTLTLFLLLSSLSLSAQHEPDAVRRRMYDSASLSRPIGTVIYQNYRYIYSVKGDTNLVRWELIKKDKLYTDYWKGAGVVYFFETWGELLILPGTPQDKILHYGAGAVIGGGSNYLYYRLTKRKWLSSLLGWATATAVGGIKELTDPLHGGAKTLPDFAYTAAGGLKGSLGVLIVIGHKEKEKKYIQP